MTLFLHSSFRVSSTWLWSRIRSKHQFVAFYEVFNEQLADISSEQLPLHSPDCWHSKHPPGAPYFLEFLPLMRETGGVANYDASMAFDLFIPSEGIDGAISKQEEIYLGGLIEHAESLGKIPLLSCKRGLGRMHAIKSAFSGFHILSYRNLFQQWCSYTSQYFGGQPFFFNTIRRTIESTLHDSFFQYLHDVFPLDRMSIDSSDYFYCFLLLHLYLYGQAADAADLLLDVNRMASDHAYRESVEREIAELTGVDVDFSDAGASIAFSFVKLGKLEDAVCRLKALGDVVLARTTSPRGRELVGKCLADFIAEYRRYDFYAGALAGECHRLSEERNKLVLERDRWGQGTFGWRLAAPMRALRNLFGVRPSG
jgi:hypothetical protein